ncbi:MAG TPA: pilus assembly protein PilM [Candidatus Dormibacteraeota bacterium]|nr:pilus assembly protein PilM [Candidatus Dormibacteraeota bacterium]
MTLRLGLDLGKRELKVVEGDGRRLKRHAETLLPDGALQDGVPTPLLTAALRIVLEAGGFEAKAARVAISDTAVAVREFRLPALPRQELGGAVMFEGRRLVPMNAEDVYYAWHAQKDRAGYSVYLVAARRDMIDAVGAAVSAVGLELDRIDLKPLALARGTGAPDGLILEWETAEATLVLMVRGRPRFFRTFLLDAAPDDVDGQLEELALSVKALVKFVRSAEPEVPIGPTTPLYVGGRFAVVENGLQRAQDGFEFAVRLPTPRFKSWTGFPWQTHLAGLGLLGRHSWRGRLTPSQGGDRRVPA